MRNILPGLAGATALAFTLAAPAYAETWPAPGKSVQIIVPDHNGSGIRDTLARLVAEQLGKRLNSKFVITYHAGANGNIGAAIAADSPSDGSRLLFSWTGTLAVNPSLYKDVRFDPEKSFEPIGLIAEVPNILVVNTKLPANNLAEFTEYVRKHPGVVNFGSTGNGSPMHLAGQIYMSETDTNMVHVPYSSSSQATTNLISGEIQSMFHVLPETIDQIHAGQMKALGVMASSRARVLPEIPTMAEQGHPELVASTWFALLAPKGTPREIIDRANQALNETLQDPAVQERLTEMGAQAMGGTPEDLGELIRSEQQKWRKVVDSIDMQLY